MRTALIIELERTVALLAYADTHLERGNVEAVREAVSDAIKHARAALAEATGSCDL
jgi:hypothetical protein